MGIFSKVLNLEIVAAAFILTACSGSLQSKTSENGQGSLSSIANGGQLTLDMVGPRAIGLTSFQNAGGYTELVDGQTYPFAKQIPSTAIYDGFTMQGPHLLIEGYQFTGTLDIYTSQNVVIRGCQFRFPTVSWNVGIRPGAGKVFVLYSDLGSSSDSGAPNDSSTDSNAGIMDMQGGSIFYRNHVSMARIGIQPDDGSQVIENYIDHFVYYNGDHIDGIMLDSPSNVQVLRNKVLVNTDQTCAICIFLDYGTPKNIQVDSNYLAGGSYTIYGGASSSGVASTNIAITNNILGLDFSPLTATYGPLAYWQSPSGSGNVWHGNIYSDGTSADGLGL